MAIIVIYTFNNQCWGLNTASGESSSEAIRYCVASATLPELSFSDSVGSSSTSSSFVVYFVSYSFFKQIWNCKVFG